MSLRRCSCIGRLLHDGTRWHWLVTVTDPTCRAHSRAAADPKEH